MMRDAFAFGLGYPGIEVGVEIVDPIGFELDDLCKFHDGLASSTMLNGVVEWCLGDAAQCREPDAVTI
jgi:hypothetical protein